LQGNCAVWLRIRPDGPGPPCHVSARKPCFAACARLVDQVKARLPVWKRQVFADGTEEWVNCP
jgi:molybdopterin synthase catalytic subunit